MTDHAQLARIAKYGANPGDREDLLARIGNLQRRRVIYQAYSARRSARSVRLASGLRLFRDGRGGRAAPMGRTADARLVVELARLVEENQRRFGRPRVWVRAQRA
jgi:hypothetical protein